MTAALDIQTGDIEPGVYDDLSIDDYHDGPGVSSSGVKAALDSLNHYRQYCDESREWKECFEEGHLIHDALLDPDELVRTYGFYDETKNRGYSGKRTKAYAKWQDARDGAIGILPGDIEMIQGIRANVAKHDVLSGMFHGARSEVSIFWREDGLLLKCRPDYLVEFDDGYVVIDLKSTGKKRGACEEQFRRIVARRDYEVSAAMYKRGAAAQLDKPILDYLFAVVEKKPPYNVGAFQLSETYLEIGRRRLDDGLDRIRDYRNNPDTFGGYANQIVTLDPPVWKQQLAGISDHSVHSGGAL